jgi:hypothetical protein
MQTSESNKCGWASPFELSSKALLVRTLGHKTPRPVEGKPKAERRGTRAGQIVDLEHSELGSGGNGSRYVAERKILAKDEGEVSASQDEENLPEFQPQCQWAAV